MKNLEVNLGFDQVPDDHTCEEYRQELRSAA